MNNPTRFCNIIYHTTIPSLLHLDYVVLRRYFATRFHPIRHYRDARVMRPIWVRELCSCVYCPSLFLDHLVTSETFPMREQLSGAEFATIWTVDPPPEDFGYVVAVVEYIFVSNGMRT